MVRRNRNMRENQIAPDHVYVGAVARLVDRAFDDPAMSGGLFVMALTVTAIVSNAMFLQPSRHPEPMFQSRGQETAVPTAGKIEVAAAGDTAVPLPRPRQRQQIGPVAATPPPIPAARPARSDEPDAQGVLLTTLQRELARLGLYAGAIDGIYGPNTQASISQFQTASGLPVTGEPSAELLIFVTTPAPAPAAPAAPAPAAPVQPETVVEVPAGPPSAPASQYSASQYSDSQVRDLAELERASIAAMEEIRLRRIQTALNKIGYGPLNVDGQVGPSTTNAIHRFELDHGMQISGDASDRLISRLVAIGALAAT
jgi:peptidoglycan hydrolase-like protein with peptidoglycan-binding domain